MKATNNNNSNNNVYLSNFGRKAQQQYKSLNAAIRALRETYETDATDEERKTVLFALGIKTPAGTLAAVDALKDVKNAAFINIYKAGALYIFRDDDGGGVAKIERNKDCRDVIRFVPASNFSPLEIFTRPAARILRKQKPTTVRAAASYIKEEAGALMELTPARADELIKLAKEAAAAKAAAKEAAANLAEEDRRRGAEMREKAAQKAK